MGSGIELNDTLKMSAEQGFPSELAVGQRYPFKREGLRLYHLAPTRVFLVEEIDGKWNFRGHAVVIKQTQDTESNSTSGEFAVIKLYNDAERQLLNQAEAPAGKAYAE